MNAKLITLAIALIVAIPILLGYGLAFEQTEHTGYESGERTNITDLVNNSNMPYMTDLSPMYSNSTLYYDYYTGLDTRVTYPGTPKFVQFGTLNPTPLTFTYEDNEHYSFELTTPYGESYTYHASAPLNQTTLPVPDNLNWIQFSSYNGETMTLTTTIAGTTYTYTGSEFGPFINSANTPGTSNPSYMVWYESESDLNGKKILLTNFTITAPEGTQIDIAGRYSSNVTAGLEFDDIPGLNYRQVSFALSPNESIVFYRGNWPDNAQATSYTNLGQPILITQIKTDLATEGAPYGKYTVTIGDYDVIEDVTALFAIIRPGTASLPALMTIVQPDYYVDPSFGWYLDDNPDGSNVTPDNAIWYNGHRNYEVRMLMSISKGSSLIVSPYENYSYRPNEVLIERSSGLYGTVSVNDEPLGDYQYLCLDFKGQHVKVSGIRAWPDMGTEPELLNSISSDLGFADSPISYIELREIYNIPDSHGESGITYRVDKATVRGGQYPIISNNQFDLSRYWPNKSYSIQLSSISMYGSSIRFGDFGRPSYTVENGAITIDGKKIPLRNAVFTSTYSEDDERWHYTINGIAPEYNTSTVPLSLYFGGKWACIVYAYELNEESWTSNEWQPGVFAFNGADNSFALLGLAGSAAVFIALALYGRHIGAKVGSLMLVCGFAGLIFLCMIV